MSSCFLMLVIRRLTWVSCKLWKVVRPTCSSSRGQCGPPVHRGVLRASPSHGLRNRPAENKLRCVCMYILLEPLFFYNTDVQSWMQRKASWKRPLGPGSLDPWKRNFPPPCSIEDPNVAQVVKVVFLIEHCLENRCPSNTQLADSAGISF